MNTTRNVLRIVLAALLTGAGFVANAQTTFTSNSPFVAVGAAQTTNHPSMPASDPAIFAYAPTNPNLNVSHPSYAGAWVNLANATPQAQIDSVRLYAYALKTGVYQHIAARFRFWNAYQAAASSVFSKPSEFVVDLTACPCNFVAGQAYSVDVALPKPVYTESTSVGFSEGWEVDTGDGMLAISADLVPALDTAPGSETAGATIAGYGNLGRSPDDLNFAPVDEPGGGRLGLGLNGTSMTLDQCTGAANFQTQFDEEFDDAGAFYQRWKANPNRGSFTVGSGFLALSASDSAFQFPYIASGAQATMIPPFGNFEVRWLAVYTGVGASGDGEMVISKGTPLNGNPADPSLVALQSWQDSGGFNISASTGSGVQQIAGNQGTTRHDMEYCWINGNVELWKDGTRIFGPAAQPANRPDSLWLGNSVAPGGGPWNPVTLYRVLVRGDQAGLVDHIFSDGFGPPPGNQ
jgi:hypothetical protein